MRTTNWTTGLRKPGGAKVVAIAWFMLAAGAAAAQSAPDVTGVWIDHTGRGAVEIVACGDKLCGYIYWVKDPLSKQGKPLLDIKNPDKRRRGQPICGTRVLANLARKGPAKLGSIWGGGTIYDPEEGEDYDAEIKLVTAENLNVLGYAGLKILSETYTWTRAPADLVRCGPARV